MESLLNTNENISDIALAFYDDKTELLKEITEQGDYFAVAPFSVQYKRLYIIGDLLYNNEVKVTAKVPTEFEEYYTVRLRFGSEYNQVDDFDSATNSVSGSYKSLGYKYLNAVPLDVLITSNGLVDRSTSIIFTLEVDSGKFACAGSTSIVYLDTGDMSYSDETPTIYLDGEYVGDIVDGDLSFTSDKIEYGYSPQRECYFYKNLTNDDHLIELRGVSSIYQNYGNIEDYNFGMRNFGELGRTLICLKGNDYMYQIPCASSRSYVTVNSDSNDTFSNYDLYVDSIYIGNLYDVIFTTDSTLNYISGLYFYTEENGRLAIENNNSIYTYMIDLKIINTNLPGLYTSSNYVTIDNAGNVSMCLSYEVPQ